jgi:small conductance mechanosensitive channel
VGDRIKAQEIEGIVTEIQIFNTILKTAEHRLVIVPNGLLSNGIIVNMSLENVRVDIEIGISGENDMPKVRAQITDMLLRNPKVARTPMPEIAIMKIEEDNLFIVVRPFTDTSDYWDVYFYAMEGIKELIDAKEIHPLDKTMHIKMLDEAADK